MDKARFDELTAGELAERLGQLRFDRGDPPQSFSRRRSCSVGSST